MRKLYLSPLCFHFKELVAVWAYGSGDWILTNASILTGYRAPLHYPRITKFVVLFLYRKKKLLLELIVEIERIELSSRGLTLSGMYQLAANLHD